MADRVASSSSYPGTLEAFSLLIGWWPPEQALSLVEFAHYHISSTNIWGESSLCADYSAPDWTDIGHALITISKRYPGSAVAEALVVRSSLELMSIRRLTGHVVMGSLNPQCFYSQVKIMLHAFTRGRLSCSVLKTLFSFFQYAYCSYGWSSGGPSGCGYWKQREHPSRWQRDSY